MTELRYPGGWLAFLFTLLATTDTTTPRQAYTDARAALNKASADLDAAAINSGPLNDGPASELTEEQRQALVAYHAAREACVAASLASYGA